MNAAERQQHRERSRLWSLKRAYYSATRVIARGKYDRRDFVARYEKRGRPKKAET